ncbi:hypothetical protein K440DRAFT_660392 [Wilcoxina mikolae CBS 423.85]|nr:hypothetical protein K440DRAFT_660392 [Wilcoxina mikolae CBS 423.85]
MKLSSFIIAPAFLFTCINAQSTTQMGLAAALGTRPELSGAASLIAANPGLVQRAQNFMATNPNAGALNMFAPVNTAGARSRLFRRQSAYDIAYQLTHSPRRLVKRNYYEKEEKVEFPVGVEESFLDNPEFFNLAEKKATGQRVVTNLTESKSHCKRDDYEPHCTPSQELQISSGLGDIVQTVGVPFKFKYGWIFPVTSHFSVPETVTDTLEKTGGKTFLEAIKKEGKGHKIDKTPSVTVFAPLNPLDCKSVLDVVLFGSVIYSPDFVAGKFEAASGATLKITKESDGFYVNGSKIVRTDLITVNGVTHYFDNKPTKKDY